MVNNTVKYRHCKVRQRRIPKYDRFKDYKVRQNWITNYDRLWIKKYNKNFENWITNCNGITNGGKFGLQISMGWIDYKVIQSHF